MTSCPCTISDGYGHQLCQAETPQETQLPDLQSANQRKGDCKAVVSGLLCGKPMKWEVVFDIEPFLNGREREEKVHEELWNETFHYLAGRSIIQDFEQMGDKECEIEHGELCRAWLTLSKLEKSSIHPSVIYENHHEDILNLNEYLAATRVTFQLSPAALFRRYS